jgi:heat shock protein HslJ
MTKSPVIKLPLTTFIGFAIATLLAACAMQPQSGTQAPVVESKPQPTELMGTQWQLVNIQSKGDANFRPSDPSKYQLAFLPQRRLVIIADCNRGGGIWAQVSARELRFTQILSTQAECDANSLYQRYMHNLAVVHSFVFQNDHLLLATVADGAILEFARIKAE